jgi:GxxExxY protein
VSVRGISGQEKNFMVELLYKKECYDIIGACIEVHKELGCGFLEAVYQEALARELLLRSIPFVREQKLEISYKGFTLNKEYFVDFICYDKILLELKALSELVSENEAQLINYLKISKLRLGMLVNFGKTKIQYKRMIL